MEKVQERSIRREHLSVASAVEGFVGVGSDLVSCERIYLPIVRHLLGNVIISKDLESAVKISDYICRIYRVISLDGQVVHVAGAISGGSESRTVSVFNINNKIEDAQTEHDKLCNEATKIKVQMEKKQSDLDVLNKELQLKVSSSQKHENSVSELKNKITNLSIEYENLTNQSFSGEEVV